MSFAHRLVMQYTISLTGILKTWNVATMNRERQMFMSPRIRANHEAASNTSFYWKSIQTFSLKSLFTPTSSFSFKLRPSLAKLLLIIRTTRIFPCFLWRLDWSEVNRISFARQKNDVKYLKRNIDCRFIVYSCELAFNVFIHACLQIVIEGASCFEKFFE